MDCIDIIMDDGTKKKMEVVNIFEIDGYKYHYIIYTEIDRSHYYLAKFLGDNIATLSMDFDEKELMLANKIFEGVVR